MGQVILHQVYQMNFISRSLLPVTKIGFWFLSKRRTRMSFVIGLSFLFRCIEGAQETLFTVTGHAMRFVVICGVELHQFSFIMLALHKWWGWLGNLSHGAIALKCLLIKEDWNLELDRKWLARFYYAFLRDPCSIFTATWDKFKLVSTRQNLFLTDVAWDFQLRQLWVE